VGPYILERELGRGGMATVYLAYDRKHERRVAVKVLHAELAAMLGPERFLQEIRVTAHLQHPHILGLIDSGVFGDEAGELRGRPYYVMPYVEGETLRKRLERERQLPIADALRIARETADALAYAHAQNFVHRDIKPENILLQQGHALVADFGIALAVQHAGGTRMTQTGLSLGTPQYMAPEQALGERSIDNRADIYALGSVLYEMLVGDPPFTGPTAQAIVAKVLTERPDAPSASRETVPPNVDAAVLTALAKLPADRFARASEFAAALADGAVITAPRRAAGTHAHRSNRVLISAICVALAAAVGLGWALRNATYPHPPAPPVRRAFLSTSPQFDVRGADMSVSADGSTFATLDATGILVRHMDQAEPVTTSSPASFSPGGGILFLSGDGSHVGLSRSRDLIVQRLDGGDAVVIQSASSSGGAFLDNQHIVVVDTGGLGIYTLRSAQRESLLRTPPNWRLFQPIVLPGNRYVLVAVVAGNLASARILAVDLKSHKADTLNVGEALRPQFADGWLYYARANGTLYAIPFDPQHLRTTGQPVATSISVVISRDGRAAYAAGHGVLVYGERQLTRLVALGPSNSRVPLFGAPAVFHNPRVSPDGRRILVDRGSGGAAGRDVWVLDRDTKTLSRATTIGDAHDAVWTPDGRSITYLSFRNPRGSVVTASVDGGANEHAIAVPGTPNPGSWLPDGSGYLLGISTLAGNSDLYLLPAKGGAPEPILVTPFDEHSPAASPYGKWVAYTSDETGVAEIYVRALHGDPNRTLISTVSGEEPVWGHDGKSVWYVEHSGNDSRLIQAKLSDDMPRRVISRTAVVDPLNYEPVGNHSNWDLTADNHAVVVEPAAESHRLVMVFDWTPDEAERRR